MGWHIVWKPFVHSTPTSNCGWPADVDVVVSVISELPKILISGLIFGPKQSGVFKLHEIIGQFTNSEFENISFMADAIMTEPP